MNRRSPIVHISHFTSPLDCKLELNTETETEGETEAQEEGETEEVRFYGKRT